MKNNAISIMILSYHIMFKWWWWKFVTDKKNVQVVNYLSTKINRWRIPPTPCKTNLLLTDCFLCFTWPGEFLLFSPVYNAWIDCPDHHKKGTIQTVICRGLIELWVVMWQYLMVGMNRILQILLVPYIYIITPVARGGSRGSYKPPFEN